MIQQALFDFTHRVGDEDCVCREGDQRACDRTHESKDIRQGQGNSHAPDVPAQVVSTESEKTSLVEPSDAKPNPVEVLRRLRARTGCITAVERNQKHLWFSTGCRSIDRILTKHGLRVDGVTEWVADSDAGGAAALSLAVLAHRLNQPAAEDPTWRRRAVVVVASPHQFFPPAAIALGIPHDNLIWVQPQTRSDAVWAIDQALRCRGVSVVWGHLDESLDDRDARRLQLAAEEGLTTAMLVRPRAVRGRPTFAETRLHVEPIHVPTTSPRAESFYQARVTVDRCRGMVGGRHVDVAMDDRGRLFTIESEVVSPVHSHVARITTPNHASASLHLAKELADPKADRQAKRRVG
ncbi:MAG: hypothetical protein AAF664_15705 [Planctomycetota bacterium]